MELIEINVDELKPYKTNPRRIDAKAVEAVKESIKQCGYITPIMVDEEMVILAGHTRFKALKSLNIDKCMVAQVKGLNEAQKRKYRILDNKTNEVSTWNYQKLFEELEKIEFDGYSFGFEKLLNAMDQDIDTNSEFTMEDFSDEQFKHECPECGFRFN